MCCCLLFAAGATPKQSLTGWVKVGEICDGFEVEVGEVCDGFEVKVGEVCDGFEALREPGGEGAEGWEVVLGVSRELQV